MTILLLILLVVYVAVVSAPISMRFARLILTGSGLRELALPGDRRRSVQRASKSGISAGLSVQPLNGSDSTGPQLAGTRMYMSKEENHEQAMVFSSKQKAGHLLVQQGRLCRQCSSSHARSI